MWSQQYRYYVHVTMIDDVGIISNIIEAIMVLILLQYIILHCNAYVLINLKHNA